MQRAPRGKSLKLQAYLLTFCSHNAEVEGSSPSLTTKINGLQLLLLDIFRDFAGLRHKSERNRRQARFLLLSPHETIISLM